MAIDYRCPEECVRDQVEALQAENAKLRAALIGPGVNEVRKYLWSLWNHAEYYGDSWGMAYLRGLLDVTEALES